MVPEVKTCKVTECYYNRDNECRAHGITVGSEEPICETFMQSSQHSNKQGAGDVGACHVNQCTYNDQLYCHACDDIVVDMKDNNAFCMTFKPR